MDMEKHVLTFESGKSVALKYGYYRCGGVALRSVTISKDWEVDGAMLTMEHPSKTTDKVFIIVSGKGNAITQKLLSSGAIMWDGTNTITDSRTCMKYREARLMPCVMSHICNASSSELCGVLEFRP